MPHHVAPSAAPARRVVVVVGGGPAGLEAARVSALRGHDVVLFEAAHRLGGQVLLAARAAWRRDLIGIVDWLEQEVRLLGVDVRLGEFVAAADVLAERPDLVVLATGGVPMGPTVPGAELAVSTWAVLAGEVPLLESALIYDDEGRHAGISTAQHLAERGVRVHLATPDRFVGRELGGVSAPTYLAALARAGVVVLADRRLDSLERHGKGVRAVLRHEYDRSIVEQVDADIVITQHGTAPNDELFQRLKPGSVNLGQLDVWALRDGTPQPWMNPAGLDGGYGLVVVGDAAASRDIHAAIYDSRRILKDL